MPVKRICWALLWFTIFILLVGLESALADNCSGGTDCANTQGFQSATLAALFALLAVIVGIALDFIPVVGEAKSLLEAARGVDTITGEPLAGWERVLAVLGAIPVLGIVARGFRRVIRTARGLDRVSDAARGVSRMGDAGRGLDRTGNAVTARGVKNAAATTKQLQKKFKHAEDFGVSGNYSPANSKKFDEAIQNHLNAPGTKEISGTYRGNPVTFNTDPKSGLTVIQNPNGSFLSGWKLNPQQLQHVLKDGKL